MQKIIGEYTDFLNKIFFDLNKMQVNLGDATIDHLCYRVPDFARYEQVKKSLSAVGDLLGEEMVNGRPISTYKLHEAIQFKNYQIPLVELPAPKSGRSYTEGLEHCEFVIEQPLNEFIADHPHLEFDARALSQAINPDVALLLPSGYVVKFHNQSLENVIALEQTLKRQQSSSSYRAILFDLDGTLCAAAGAFDSLVCEVMSEYLKREVTADEVLQKHSPHYYSLFEKFGVTDRDIIFKLIEKMGSRWRFDRSRLPIYAGIETLLAMSQQAGIDLYIWTARDPVSVDHTLQTLGLRHYFKDVFAFDRNTGGKPVPTERQLQVLLPYGRQMLMIGDTSVDKAAAENLCIDFFEARWRDAGQEHLIGDVFKKVFRITN